jgi:hypothetical protein
MKTALRFVVVALALGLIAATYGYLTISRSPRLEGARDAGLAAGFPFFGVAVLALVIAFWRRGQPEALLPPAVVVLFVSLFVLSGVWVLFILLIWGL